MLLGCETMQLCAACGETAAAPTVQCDRCHEWYHPHCQDIDGFELWRLWYCSACLPMTVPVAPAPEAYVPPIHAQDPVAWVRDVAAALERSYKLEVRFWQDNVDHSVTLRSLACPFSATATEGPIGILKELSSPAGGRRVECMLRALLTARRYDVGAAEAEHILPFEEHLYFTRPVARVLLVRDGLGKRKEQRGEAMLATLDQERDSQAAHTAKKQRVADGMSRRVEDADELLALSQTRGTTRALHHQAGLWDVKAKKTKAQTTAAILKAMEASQRSAGEPPQPDSEGDVDGLL